MKYKVPLLLFIILPTVCFGLFVMSNSPYSIKNNFGNHESESIKASRNDSLDEIKIIAAKTTQAVNHTINEGILAAESTSAPALVQSAREQIGITTIYDPAYVKLDYPMGDVPQQRGVCTDVVVRAYRNRKDGQNKDLQELVNSDMKKAWSQYPKIWGLKTTDKNIDHRRVPNLRVFFKRNGKSLEVSDIGSDYKAGDLVTWKIGGKLPHIGIVSNKTTANGTPLIIHNIGRGTQEENILFDYPITGHYRY